MDLLGVAHPHPTWPLDGISLAEFFGPATPTSRPKPIGFWWGPTKAWIDNDIKLIGDPGSKGTGVGVGQGCSVLPPYHAVPAVQPLLFNLSESETESVDIKAANPGLFKRAVADFLAWQASVQYSIANESRCGGGAPPRPRPSPPAPAPPPPSSNCTFVERMLGFGHDGWARPAASKEECCAMCLADPACTVAVWRLDGDDNSATCHGKTPESKPGRKGEAGDWACRARSKPSTPRLGFAVD